MSGEVTGAVVEAGLEFLMMTGGYVLEFEGGNSKEFLHSRQTIQVIFFFDS